MNTRLGGVALATLATAVALCAAPVSPSSAVGAAASADACITAYPIADLVAGAAVTGLTVSEGVDPDPFTGEVVGVVTSGIAPGIDMVMVDLTSPAIDRVGGIWAGMSGSPVYAEDGRLIGAVAYGLTYGPSPVAGVTPFELMDDYTTVPPATVSLNAAQARTVAARTDVTVTQASQGFTRLPLVGGVSGVQPFRLATYKHRAYRDRSLQAWPIAMSTAAGPENLVAGGNLAVSQAYGDIVMGAVGTVTWTCDGRLVGFGHPEGFLGRTTEVMHPADAVYVQADPASTPFKVANPGAPAGTITDDHLTGVTGDIGPLPETLDLHSTVTFGARENTAVTHVAIQRVAPDATYFTVVSNQDRVVDGLIAGSEDSRWTIRGHRADDSPFTVRLGQQYLSRVDITGAAVWDVADEMYLLSEFPGVTLDRLVVTGDVVADTTTWELAGVQARYAGAWHDLMPGDTVPARAGTTLHLRLVLSNDAASTKVPVGIDLPARLAGTTGKFRIQPGQEVFSLQNLWDAASLDEFLTMARHGVRADQTSIWVEALRADRLVFGRTLESPAVGKIITANEDHSYELVIR